jgi:hypothetical protein
MIDRDIYKDKKPSVGGDIWDEDEVVDTLPSTSGSSRPVSS